MKLIYIDDFFHPDAGYMDNILCKYWSQMGHDVYMLTSELDKMPNELKYFFGEDNISKRDGEFERENKITIVRIPLVGYISGRAIFSKKILVEIDNIHPDVIFVSENDSMIGMWLTTRAAKNDYYPMVFDCHMLDIASHNPLRNIYRWYYRKLYAPIVNRNRWWVIRTQDDDYPIRRLGIDSELCPYVSFGTDVELFKPDEIQKFDFRQEYNIPNDAFVVMYAGKLNLSKGINILVEALEQLRTYSEKLYFMIIGTTEGETKEKYDKRLEGDNILRFPTQKYCDLHRFYKASDIAVYPRECSLSYYDVQSCGLPVVFDDNSVNVGRADHNNALTFRQGDSKGLSDAILKFYTMDKAEFNEYKKNARADVVVKNNYANIAREYIRYFEDAIFKRR